MLPLQPRLLLFLLLLQQNETPEQTELFSQKPVKDQVFSLFTQDDSKVNPESPTFF